MFRNRMIGGGRHMMASRRRASISTGLEIPASPGALKGVSPRRRRAVAVQDHKSCALIQTRLKLGELVWVGKIINHVEETKIETFKSSEVAESFHPRHKSNLAKTHLQFMLKLETKKDLWEW